MSTLLKQVIEPCYQPTTPKTTHKLDVCPVCNRIKQAQFNCQRCKKAKRRPPEDLNIYSYRGMLFRRLALAGFKYALVSEHRYELLNRLSWYAKWNRATKDFRATSWHMLNGEGVQSAMHRLITNAPKGMVVDHWNHDGLDNRDENLTVCSHSLNHRNKRVSIRSSTGRTGVSYCSRI
jgi:hypothetical protein